MYMWWLWWFLLTPTLLGALLHNLTYSADSLPPYALFISAGRVYQEPSLLAEGMAIGWPGLVACPRGSGKEVATSLRLGQSLIWCSAVRRLP
ncbi:hypothetical protein GGR56DRAFT_157105 [Xylariaceae sp. FL0804]|nr:hypothetical protein GGR56DRAFT_157105 [Xylariaceae sp. FL0804]